MKTRMLLLLAVVLVSSGTGGVLLYGHHSFAAEFSRDLPVEVTGEVTNVEWMNPHARFYVDVKDDQGKVENWNFELSSPNVLMRNGWTRNSLRVGAMVTVTGSRAKNAPNVASASNVTLADGQRLFSGQAVGDQVP
jgi:Family of unknown function (DUF6152)